jgi:hypothetical protein
LIPTDPFDIGRRHRYNNIGPEKGDTGYDAALIQKQFKIVTGHQGGSGFWTGAETVLASPLPSSHFSLIFVLMLSSEKKARKTLLMSAFCRTDPSKRHWPSRSCPEWNGGTPAV